MTFKGPRLAFALTPVQRKKDTVRCAGLRTMSSTTDGNLDCVFVKNALVLVVSKTGGPTEPPWHPLSDPLAYTVYKGALILNSLFSFLESNPCLNRWK